MDDNALPSGSISLEDEPAIVGLGQPETPEAEAAAPDDEAVPDGTIEGTGGVQFAPVKAVIAERTQRKEAQKQLAAIQEQLTAAQQKAMKYDELAGYVDQARPIIEAVRNRPDLVEQARQPKQEAAAPKPMSDAEAIDYARDFDLYTPDGKPDVDRAQRLVAREQARAERAAQAAIAPFQANDAQRASATMKQQILAYKDSNGHTVDAAILNDLWAGVPAELSAKPEVAGVLYQMALGATVAAGKYKGTQPPGPPPALQTESLGSRGGVTKDLDVFGQKFAKAADIKPSEFAKASGRYVPGQTNSLED